MRPISFLSFDVEALPGRAISDHIDRLMWGKINGGEHGVGQICRILNEYGLKGNFLIDLSACALHGDKKTAEVGKFILDQGHELHAHLHPEWLVRHWGIKGDFNGPPGLDQLDTQLNTDFLRYAAFKFKQLFGLNIDVFRGGGFHFNAHTIAAASDVGIRCLSNFNNIRHNKMVAVGEYGANNEPFAWDNGVIELPVDFSPEPLSFDIQKYFGWFDRVNDRKKIKTFNLTMHSWSLLRKTGEIFDTYAADHEERLRYICEHLIEHTTVMGYSDYLDTLRPEPADILYFEPTERHLAADHTLVRCNICSANFVRTETDVCPGCSSRARHRQVADVLSKGHIENPFSGKRVLACFANSVEKQEILKGASEIQNFDIRPVAEVDYQMDIQDMSRIADESFDAFIALHVLNHVKDDRAALREVHRILKPGGRAMITVPYRIGERTTEMSNLVEHYGIENFEKYGVGSYRRYGLDEVTALFSEHFNVDIMNGFDPVVEMDMKIFVLTK